MYICSNLQALNPLLHTSIYGKHHKALYGLKQALVPGSTGSPKPFFGLIFTQVYVILPNWIHLGYSSICYFSLEKFANLNNFLGIGVKNLSNGCLLLCQTKCILDLLTEADMACEKCISIPIVGGCSSINLAMATYLMHHYRSVHLYRSVMQPDWKTPKSCAILP